MTDDKVIIDGLKMIQSGVQELNWELVCEGFEHITGQKIEPPQPKLSQSERIKQAFASEVKVETKESVGVDDMLEQMTVREIVEELKNLDYKSSDLKGKKKYELVQMLKEHYPTEIVESKTNGHVKFVSYPKNEEEYEENLKRNKNKPARDPNRRGMSSKEMIEKFSATDDELKSGTKTVRVR